MDKKNCGDYEVTCSSCGRPWAVCKEKGGCNECGDVRFCEYGRRASGCIRQKQPDCPMQAVIPSVTVENINGIKGLSDCLVHVADINTTYYIDDHHRLLTTWGGPVSVYNYDFDENPLRLRNQMAYDTANNILAIFDKAGVAYTVPINNLDNDYAVLVNKPQINGHTLIGNKTSHELGLQGELTAGSNIQIEGNTISAIDTTYTAGNGIELDGTEIKAKIGDGLEFGDNGEIAIDAARIPTKTSDLENDSGFISDDTETISGDGSVIVLRGTKNIPLRLKRIKGDSESPAIVTGENIVNITSKNLFVNPTIGEAKGVTFKLNEDGTYDITGTATAQANNYIEIPINSLRDGEGYVLSANKPLVNVNVYLEVFNGTTWVRHALGNFLNASRQSISGIIDLSGGNKLKLTLRVQNGATANMAGLGIQLELGSSATSYVPHKEQRYELSLGNMEIGENDYIHKVDESWLKYDDATTSDIEITDKTLIEQLGALDEAIGYEDQTVIITGATSTNLPMILEIEQYPNSLPVATSEKLGNIIAGKGLQVSESGILSTSNSTVKMFFPEISGLSGDMSILTFDDGETKKNAIIDFYAWDATAYEATMQKILAQGVSKIDYAFVSHYHSDHIGFLTHMLNDSRFDFSDCVFYLPITPDYTRFVGGVGNVPANENTIIAAIEAKGFKIVNPTNSMAVEINKDTTISFLNCIYSDFETYYSITGGVSWSENPVTVYNNFSMVVQVNHGNQRLLFTGDIEAEAQKVIIEQGLQVPDFIKVEHHGRNGLYDNDGSTGHDMDFVRKYWRPAIAVGMGDHTTNIGVETLLKWQSYLYEIYYTSISGDVSVVSDGQSVLAKSERGVFRPDGTTLGDVLDMLGLGQSFKPTILADNTDLNDITTAGDYMSTSYVHTGTMTNIPNDGISHMFNLRVRQFGTGTSGYCEQTFVPASSPKFYMRFKTSTGWSTWVKFTGTSVS